MKWSFSSIVPCVERWSETIVTGSNALLRWLVRPVMISLDSYQLMLGKYHLIQVVIEFHQIINNQKFFGSDSHQIIFYDKCDTSGPSYEIRSAFIMQTSPFTAGDAIVPGDDEPWLHFLVPLAGSCRELQRGIAISVRSLISNSL